MAAEPATLLAPLENSSQAPGAPGGPTAPAPLALPEPAPPAQPAPGDPSPDSPGAVPPSPAPLVSPPSDGVVQEAPTADVPARAPGIPTEWDIDISLAGHQAEVDRCVWVRMDLEAVAPIVGAHNGCGGEVVLEMAIGDTVRLSGFDLDGAYLVTDDRDASAGDVAAEATAGMTADVVLQTCYYSSDGRERLIALKLIPGSST